MKFRQNREVHGFFSDGVFGVELVVAGDFQELETQQSQEGSRALVNECFVADGKRGTGGC